MSENPGFAGEFAENNALAGLPAHWWFYKQRLGFILGFKMDGELTHNFQNAAGMPVKHSDIASVHEVNGKLYVGSLIENSFGVFVLPNNQA